MSGGAGELPALLLALRLGDSGFPGGGFAFSWGLETALRDGRTDRRALGDWIGSEIDLRWVPFDAPALAGGWRASGAAALADWAARVDECHWAEAPRRASHEAGMALLTATAAMALPSAAALREAAATGRLRAHLPVMQGALWRAAGLDLPTALALSGLGAARGLASAAVRLGALGAIGAQALIAGLEPRIARAAAGPPPEGALPEGFPAVSDVALLRPAPDRLFVN
ncbi:urease accessory protein UreF [Oceanicella sp. SM1341]|uniref:urease accessory protein UreF n=1 Tax=Oceanicella sp. SM1341 TaxID=1548889 RepID=UPI000E4FB5B4|nr:urease accessory UreF family protein [Oceanicella sp. SM1341]